MQQCRCYPHLSFSSLPDDSLSHPPWVFASSYSKTVEEVRRKEQANVQIACTCIGLGQGSIMLLVTLPREFQPVQDWGSQPHQRNSF